MSKITLVLGASTSSYRYSHTATHRLIANGHKVCLVGKGGGEIANNEILDDWPEDLEIDTITMYLAPENQLDYYDLILNSGANRLIFNPGSENAELERRAKERGIDVKEACTLVMLSTGLY